MVDREKVIKGLEHCEIGGSGTCYEKECPHYQIHCCTDELKNDILVMLKEQEPQKVINQYANWDSELIGNCPKCNAILYEFDNAKACGECGQAVKWK